MNADDPSAGLRRHWQSVYQARDEVQTSWFRPHLDESLRLIGDLGLPVHLPVIDVGAGRSTLAADLLQAGFSDVTALDLSEAALAHSGARIGDDPRMHWIVGDVLNAVLPAQHFQLWHDRAVFHFLTDADDRRRYVDAVAHCLRQDGVLMLATFAADGPARCSGLETRRYDAAALAGEFSPGFVPVAHSREIHLTSSGAEQPFTCVVLRRKTDATRHPFPLDHTGAADAPEMDS